MAVESDFCEDVRIIYNLPLQLSVRQAFSENFE